MVEIVWTQEAALWLEEIHSYIAEDNPQAARTVVAGIYQKAQLLQLHPEAGYLHQAASGADIRILLYGHYRIAYIQVADSRIDILGVFHGAMSLDRYLP